MEEFEARQMKLNLENILEDLSTDHKMYAQCCVCQRYRLDTGAYTHVSVDFLEDQGRYVISHTYCPPCADKTIKEMKK